MKNKQLRIPARIGSYYNQRHPYVTHWTLMKPNINDPPPKKNKILTNVDVWGLLIERPYKNGHYVRFTPTRKLIPTQHINQPFYGLESIWRG